MNDGNKTSFIVWLCASVWGLEEQKVRLANLQMYSWVFLLLMLGQQSPAGGGGVGSVLIPCSSEQNLLHTHQISYFNGWTP